MRFLLSCLLAATVACAGCSTKKAEETTQNKPIANDKTAPQGPPLQDVAPLPPLQQIIDDYYTDADLAEKKYPHKWFQFEVWRAKVEQRLGLTLSIQCNFDDQGNPHIFCILDEESTKLFDKDPKKAENFIVVGKFSALQGAVPSFEQCHIVRMTTPEEAAKARANLK